MRKVPSTVTCMAVGDIYSFTLDTIDAPELCVSTNLSTSQYVQAMEINPNDGKLYWTSYYAVSFLGFTFGYSYFYEIDVDAQTYVRYNDLSDELSCLIIPEENLWRRLVCTHG